MDLNSNMNTISFKGRREDLKNIKRLTENEMPILTNKKKLILSSIDAVAKTADERDIKMLMGTVETMKYGIHNNSEFAKELGGSNGEKENTDWDGILKDTVRNAIDNSDIADKTSLEAQFQKVFNEERPLTEEEKQMLELRQQILGSKEMKNVLDDPNKVFEVARTTQNLNYFLASSEINNQDKIKCLKLMNHFLSDEYEIHPQLKGYKVQAFSEMVNDLIIKRPDEEVLTIKDANQKQSGMCAAISIARKAVTYEDKVRAMEIMMAELDNKPTIEVYDRTQLGSGKKISIEKAHVDFTDAISKGYRIVDTGAHQWMNVANVVGDGSISTAHYQAFDPENYEIFRDSRWLNDLSPEYKPAQKWLRHLSKERGAIKNALKRNASIAKVSHEIGEFKNEYEAAYQKSKAGIREILSKGNPQAQLYEATNLTRKILGEVKSENNALNIINNDSDELKSKKLTALIKKEMPEISDKYLADNLSKLVLLRDTAVDSADSLSQLKKHSNPKAIFAHNKNLFNAAAHHRRSVEAELEMPENITAYEKEFNVPLRENLIQDTAKDILANLNSKSAVEIAAEKLGVDANAASVKAAVEKAVRTSEIEIPAQLDGIIEKLGFGNRVALINVFINDAQEQIKAGDAEVLRTYAENAHIKPDAAIVLKKLDNVKASLADNPSNKQIAEAVSVLGYNNQIEMTADMYKTLTDITGSDIKTKEFISIGKEIKNLFDKQAQIERKLGLPSRKDVILNLLESTGEIVPEKTLQAMQAKFDKVAGIQTADRGIVDPNVKKAKVPVSVYMFTKDEKQQFAQIGQKLNSWKQYAKVNAAAMNKYLDDQLTELYAEDGRLTGSFWNIEEGESGLFDNQSVKVLEMITGKKYYNEPDIDKVVAKIKKGEGSGTSSTNVKHSEYSGHAQYVAEVSPVEVIDPVTKERVLKDVLWHDNTWGRCEDEAVWTDDKGVQRTDYSSGYGGPDGYVFDKRFMTGTFVDDVKVTPGILNSGDKFDLWRSTRIQGIDVSADKKLNEIFDDILGLGRAEQTVYNFEDTIKNVKAPLNIKVMDILEAKMDEYQNRIIDKIENGNLKTQEAIDNLDENWMKFVLNKTALQMSSGFESVSKYIENINDEKALNSIKDKLPKIHKEMIAAAFGKGVQAPAQVFEFAKQELLNIFEKSFTDENFPKNFKYIIRSLSVISSKKSDGSINSLKTAMSENAKDVIMKKVQDKKIAEKLAVEVSNLFEKVIDEKMTIKTLDDAKLFGDMKDIITKYTDKKFATSTDEDLLAAYKKLQNMTNSEFNKFIADATNDDLGIKNVTALDVAKQVNAKKSIPTKLTEMNARSLVFVNDAPAEDAPEWEYRGMLRLLQPVVNYSTVTREKNESLQKYGARGAFPKAEILSPEEIGMASLTFASSIENSVAQIKGYKDDEKAVANSELKAGVRVFVNSNVLPSERGKAIALINNYIKVLKNNPDSDATTKARDKVIGFISENHITTDTTELLKDYIKELQSPDSDENKLSVLREYMITAVENASVAAVEMDLMEVASKGQEARTREKMRDYSLTTIDGRKVSLDSDEGIDYLVTQLANPSNNSTAVQVFFAQTGLSEKAVDVIAKSVNPKGISFSVKVLGGYLLESCKNIKNLNNVFDKFLSDNTISYSSYKDSVEHYVKILDKEYMNKSQEEQKLCSAYKEFLLTTINSDSANRVHGDEIFAVLEQIHDIGIQNINSTTIKGIQKLQFMHNDIAKKISAIEALKLPKNSEKEEVRVKFTEEAKAAQAALDEAIAKINEALGA